MAGRRTKGHVVGPVPEGIEDHSKGGRWGAGNRARMSADKHRRFCEAIALGMTYNDAAIYADIQWATFLKWRRLGETHIAEGEDTIYARFVADFERAGMYAKGRAIASVQSKIPSDPHLALKWLESRYPEEYGRRVGDVRVAGEVAVEMQHRYEVSLGDLIDPTGLPDHLIERTLALVAEIDAWKAAEAHGEAPRLIDVEPDPEPAPSQVAAEAAARVAPAPPDVEAEIERLLREGDR